MALNKIERRKRIHYRIRKVVNGTAERPRLVVFRSNKQIYAQVIDDLKGVTLAAAASNDKELIVDCKGKTGVEAAALVGKKIAERALAKGIHHHHIVVDREWIWCRFYCLMRCLEGVADTIVVADVNGDGKVTVTDVQLLVDIILEKNISSAKIKMFQVREPE